MVTAAGGIKITDFGIAKALQASGGRSLTADGTTVGTPAYMAPEQALGTGVGPETDLYAVGVMAYEMLSGAVPFPEDESPLVTLLRHANEPVPPLREIDPSVPRPLSDWVARMLAKEPGDRPPGAAKAWDELPVQYKQVMETAGAECWHWSMARFDELAPPAMRRLIATGSQLRPYSREIMSAAYKA